MAVAQFFSLYQQCFGLHPNGRIYVRKKCPISRNSGTRT